MLGCCSVRLPYGKSTVCANFGVCFREKGVENALRFRVLFWVRGDSIAEGVEVGAEVFLEAVCRFGII